MTLGAAKDEWLCKESILLLSYQVERLREKEQLAFPMHRSPSVWLGAVFG